MSQETREKQAKHFKSLGIPDNNNPYINDLKEESVIDKIFQEEPEIRKKKVKK